MKEKYLTALISICVIFISVTASVYVGKMNNKAQFEKFRIEIEQKYTQHLFKKRMEVYPGLYAIISGFAKKSNIGVATSLDVNNALVKINEWDSNFAIFASDSLIGKLSDMRYDFHKMLELSNPELKDIEVRKKIYHTIRDVEISLQGEIGIFATRGFHNPKWFDN